MLKNTFKLCGMSEPLRDIFIRNLKYYRKQSGLSQEKLSYAINMSMNYINQLENKNSFPPPEIIDKISNVLKIKPVKLFDENQCPTNIIASQRSAFAEELAKNVQERLRIDIQQAVLNAIKEAI